MAIDNADNDNEIGANDTVPCKQINVESTLIDNVDIWLKMKVETKYIYRRCFNVGKTMSIELRRFNVDEPMLFQL